MGRRVIPRPAGLLLCGFLLSRAIPERVSTLTALAPVGFSFNDEPTVNSQDELAVATSGSHNLRRRSNG
jgi:hypothetical protein